MDKEIKEMLGFILDKLNELDSKVDSLESKMELRMDRLESRMDSQESRMDRLESRQDEIYLIVKAIEHSNQVRGAEIDSLKFRGSHLEGTINAIGEVIITRKAI